MVFLFPGKGTLFGKRDISPMDGSPIPWGRTQNKFLSRFPEILSIGFWTGTVCYVEEKDG